MHHINFDFASCSIACKARKEILFDLKLLSDVCMNKLLYAYYKTCFKDMTNFLDVYNKRETCKNYE